MNPPVPNRIGLQAEGEGALSQNLGTKKNQADFALWKASKVRGGGA